MFDFLNLPEVSGFLEVFEVYGYFLVILAAVFSLIASARVNSTFKKYSRVQSCMGMTGSDAARMVLMQNGVSNVQVKGVKGSLTDHYDPRDNTIYLSETVINSTSVAAIGVAAHEAGHAVQHAVGYAPIKLRTAIVPVTNIGSKLAMPIFLVGIILSFGELAVIGALLYGICVVFQLVTLPTEFNASRRAMEAISSHGQFSEEELKGARKTLTSAAMTYVAALAATLVQFLRLLAIANNSRRRR